MTFIQDSNPTITYYPFQALFQLRRYCRNLLQSSPVDFTQQRLSICTMHHLLSNSSIPTRMAFLTAPTTCLKLSLAQQYTSTRKEIHILRFDGTALTPSSYFPASKNWDCYVGWAQEPLDKSTINISILLGSELPSQQFINELFGWTAKSAKAASLLPLISSKDEKQKEARTIIIHDNLSKQMDEKQQLSFDSLHLHSVIGTWHIAVFMMLNWDNFISGPIFSGFNCLWPFFKLF